MGALARFEQFIEQLMEGSFTRLLRSQLQPVQIAKRVARAMEDSRVVSAGGRIVVANRYEVLLNPQDYSLFEPYRASLERELAEYVSAAAKENHFTLASQPMVVISSSPAAMPKRPLVKGFKADSVTSSAANKVSVSADSAALTGETGRLNLNMRPSARVQARAYLRPCGVAGAEPVVVNRLPYAIGRGLDNDLVLEDARVSRHHARIEELNKRLLLLDLQSTNGTSVNGQTISRCLLSNGDVISLGGLEFLLGMEERD